MVTKLYTITGEATLMMCVDLMIRKSLQRLPVLDKDKNILGMVYIRDLYDFIANILTEGAAVMTTVETAHAVHNATANSGFWIACSIFIVALVIIISEKIHKTVIALFGAALVLVLKILDQHEAFHLEEFRDRLERDFFADRHDDDHQPDAAHGVFRIHRHQKR